MPISLTAEDVLAIHDEVMTRLGAKPMPVRGGGLAMLEAALARPEHAALYTDADVFHQAALLTIGLAQAHAFLDGNKRTATGTVIVFLGLAELRVRDGFEMEFARRLEKAIGASGEGRELATHDMAEWLRTACESRE